MELGCSDKNKCTARRIEDKGRCFLANASDVTSETRRDAIRYRDICKINVKNKDCILHCCGDCPNKGFGRLGLSI